METSVQDLICDKIIPFAKADGKLLFSLIIFFITKCNCFEARKTQELFLMY